MNEEIFKLLFEAQYCFDHQNYVDALSKSTQAINLCIQDNIDNGILLSDLFYFQGCSLYILVDDGFDTSRINMTKQEALNHVIATLKVAVHPGKLHDINYAWKILLNAFRDTENYEELLSWSLKAVENDSSIGYLFLASMYDAPEAFNCVVKADLEKAISYYEKCMSADDLSDGLKQMISESLKEAKSRRKKKHFGFF